MGLIISSSFSFFFSEKKVEECVPRTQIPLLPAKVHRDIIPELNKWKSAKSNLAFFLLVPNLVYKFKMICLRGTDVIERNPNAEQTDGRM